jgi:hypothetical protein
MMGGGQKKKRIERERERKRMKRKREQKKGDGKVPFLPGNCGTRRCQLAANASVQIYTGRVCVAECAAAGGVKKKGGGEGNNKK